jgi:hypothetical protein
MQRSEKLMPIDVAIEKCEWETVNEFGNEATERLQVPGGWLYYRYQWKDDGTGRTTTSAMVFVPDPHGPWLRAFMVTGGLGG